MTEKEWNESTNVNKMLNFAKGDRKLRLFACACVRQVWHLLTDDRSKQAVIVAEQYADGLVSEEKLITARRNAWSAYDAARHDDAAARYAAAGAASVAAVYDAAVYDAAARYTAAAYWAAADAASVRVTMYIPLLKDIFDPFDKYKKPHCDKYTKQFARTIYENPNEKGELLDLHILADMLLDQCVDQGLVDHLRNGIHVRGCQVIDLILEKQ